MGGSRRPRLQCRAQGGLALRAAGTCPWDRGLTAKESRPARRRVTLASVLASVSLAWFAGVGGMGPVLAGGAATASPNEGRAGLVVRFPDGSVAQRCVALGAPERSGAELLTLAGLEPVFEYGSLGASVCAIAGQGCRYPAESCWCKCQQPGADCQYWAYYVLQAGRWEYATTGAADRIVRDGDVEGWAWTTGGATPASEPLPVITFEELCGQGRATPRPAPQGGASAGRSIRAVGVSLALLALAAAALLGRRPGARRRRRRVRS